MVILDTNHFTELVRESSAGGLLLRRIAARGTDVFVTVITAQESFEGWCALINRRRAGLEQTRAYIITNNVRHFAGSDSPGIRAITPAEALAILRTQP